MTRLKKNKRGGVAGHIGRASNAYLARQTSGVGLQGLALSGESSERPKQFRVGSLNVGTLRGKAAEIVETASRRRVDLCCLQETRWKGGLDASQNRMIKGKDSCYKFYWAGNQEGTGGVGIILAERWVEKVFEVQRVSDRILLLKLVIGKAVYSFLSVYAPQVGRRDEDKVHFYDQLRCVISKIPASEILIPCGDWNGHVGESVAGYEGVHGGNGWGKRNAEGESVLEFAVSCDLVIGNTCFKKRPSHLITYQSGGASTQIDYILLRKSFRKQVVDVKVIPGEDCAPQHRLLVCDFKVDIPPQRKKKFVPRLRTWRLKDPAVQQEFYEAFTAATQETNTQEESTEAIWSKVKTGLLSAAEVACGYSKKHQWRNETWWWNAVVDSAVREKRRCFSVWKKGGSRADYNEAKRLSNRAVYLAKSAAEKATFDEIDPNGTDIYRLANQMRRENQDVTGEKPVRNDAGELSLDEEGKQKAWKEHYERLSNVEFDWDPDHLSDESPVEGPAPEITLERVIKAIGSMKNGKAPGPSEIVAEMLKASRGAGAVLIRDLIASIIHDGKIPADWEESFIVSLYKGKGAALERGNYRGLKLLDQVMKVLERVAESFIRQQVNIDEMQFGFMPGRGTTDAIFILRQLQEKYLAAEKPLFMAFVDLEKAFDRVPRRVIWWALRKLGCEEWLVSLVQSMYENARSRVRVGAGSSEEFWVKVGVHQGSCLSPLLFIIVLEALSQEFRTGCPWEDLYADDLAIIAESLEELLEKLHLWKSGMETKGLRVNMGKTKVLVSGPELGVLKKSGKNPCSVCLTGTGSNSISCKSCKQWVHKRCSGISGRLTDDSPLDFKCKRCCGEARPIDGRPMSGVDVGGEALEVVASFCYLGDNLSAGGGCELATITRCGIAWKKFHQLLPILTSRYLSPITRGRVYNACVRSAMLHASETWELLVGDRNRLRRNDRAMIRWMCGVSTKDKDKVSSDSLLERLGLDDIEKLFLTRRLRWAGHVERSEGWINRVRNVEVTGGKRKGRPKKTWGEGVRNDRLAMGLKLEDASDRRTWGGTLRSSVRQDPPLFARD